MPAISLFENFNSHAHVERDTNWIAQTNGTKISTHTLTWSVTYMTAFSRMRNTISTHTLTWSVTIFDLTAMFGSGNISTHTLTWSVTKGKR